ncbi:hypothetical protein ACM614_19110, partial [Streptomyces sp. 12297]
AAPGASAAPPARPPAPAGYLPVRTEVELTSPDAGYEFDLKAGKVVPEETAAWYLARTGEEFVLPEDSDAFVAAGDALGPADCVRGIETQPVTVLPFGELGERPFCVRSADQKDIVVVRLIEALTDGGSVTVVLDQYRRTP